VRVVLRRTGRGLLAGVTALLALTVAILTNLATSTLNWMMIGVLALIAGLTIAFEIWRNSGPILEEANDAGRLESNGFAVPEYLPHGVADFTGRVAHLEELTAIAASPVAPGTTRLVLIHGTPGAGKTALAVHWAHRVRHEYPDGQLFIDLHGYSHEASTTVPQALDGLVRALGVPPGRIPVGEAELAGLYRSVLARRKVLIVLDNVGSARQVLPLLPASSDCLVLATSRDRLNALTSHARVKRIALGVLTPDESIELITAIVGRQAAQSDPAACQRLSSTCARLPLALCIAAAQADRPWATIGSVAEALGGDDPLSVLTAGENENLAVRKSMDLSYFRLDEPKRALFRRLALIPGPHFTAPAAACLVDEGNTGVGQMLTDLADANLIESAGGGRFRIHDLLRAYARHRTDTEDGPDYQVVVTDRLFSWYLTVSDTASRLIDPVRRRLTSVDSGTAPAGAPADDSAAFRWFDLELPNLVAATRRAGVLGRHRYAWELADALYSYFEVRKYWTDWFDTLKIGRAAAATAAERMAEASMVEYLGNAHWSLGKHTDAMESYAAALTIRREIGDRWGEGESLCDQGVVAWGLGRFDESITFLRQALEISQQVGDRWSVSYELSTLGNALRDSGRYDEAIISYREAMAVQEADNDRYTLAYTMNALGMTYLRVDNLAEAESLCERSLEMRHDLGHEAGVAASVHTLARIAIGQGSYQSALDRCHEAADIYRRIGDRFGEGVAANSTGRALFLLGRVDEALTWHSTALDILRGVGRPFLVAVALTEAGIAARADGDVEAARSRWREALTLYDEMGAPDADLVRRLLASIT